MHAIPFKRTLLSLTMLSVLPLTGYAQTTGQADADASLALPSMEIRASADASAEGLRPAYAGGQVARGGEWACWVIATTWKRRLH